MQLDNITIFKGDDKYSAIFINGIKVFEKNVEPITFIDILNTIYKNEYYLNNKLHTYC